MLKFVIFCLNIFKSLFISTSVLIFVLSIRQTQKIRIMTKQQIKIEIEKLAKEENLTFIEAASAMQGAEAKMGGEKMITVIHELKMESIA